MEAQEKKTFLVRMPTEQYQRLKSEADKDLRSVNNLALIAIADFLKRREASKEGRANDNGASILNDRPARVPQA